MIERRLEGHAQNESSVREAIRAELSRSGSSHNSLHSSLLRLADRSRYTALVSTNQDRMFDSAARSLRLKLKSYCISQIPRPSLGPEFQGILYLHGALPNRNYSGEMVFTEQDFGEYYFRRRTIPDFIYDASRLFSLVFVGYRASASSDAIFAQLSCGG